MGQFSLILARRLGLHFRFSVVHRYACSEETGTRSSRSDGVSGHEYA